jgi:topoisomerase IV subunit A
MTNPKVKLGKKALSADQIQLKATVLAVLDTVRDESGKDAAVRLVFEPKTSRISQDELLNTLLAHTSLEASVSVNLVSIGRDGRPRQMGLMEMLSEWVSFRVDTVRARTVHRLAKVDDRIHILEGRQTVLLNIDEVIAIIREADEPKVALIARFSLSDRQAEDILEIRLRQLARLEAIKIEQELQALQVERKDLSELIDSDGLLRKKIIKEIEGDAKTYGDDRRTLIQAAEKSVIEVKVIDEPVTVIISEKGWVRARQGHGHDKSQFSFKAGDGLDGAFEVRTIDTLYALASNGRVYSVPVSSLPSARGDGQPITSFIESEAGVRIASVFAAQNECGVLLASAQGNGLICQAGDLQSRVKNGKQFMNLDEGDVPLKPALFTPGMDSIVCASEEGRVLMYAIDEVKVLKNGGRGVILMGLEKKESLSAVIVTDARGVIFKGLGRGGKVREDQFSRRALEDWRGARARKGKLLEPRVKTPILVLPLN